MDGRSGLSDFIGQLVGVEGVDRVGGVADRVERIGVVDRACPDDGQSQGSIIVFGEVDVRDRASVDAGANEFALVGR